MSRHGRYLVTFRWGWFAADPCDQEPVTFFFFLLSPSRGPGGSRETDNADSQFGGGVWALPGPPPPAAAARVASLSLFFLSLSPSFFLFNGCYLLHAVRRQDNDSETLNASGSPKQPGMDKHCQSSLSEFSR